MAWNIPLASWDQLSLLCPHPVYALSQRRNQAVPDGANTAQKQLETAEWYQHYSDPKHCTAAVVLGTKLTQSQ